VHLSGSKCLLGAYSAIQQCSVVGTDNYHVCHHSMPTMLITRSHPEMVGDMSRVTLNFDLSKTPFVRF